MILISTASFPIVFNLTCNMCMIAPSALFPGSMCTNSKRRDEEIIFKGSKIWTLTSPVVCVWKHPLPTSQARSVRVASRRANVNTCYVWQYICHFITCHQPLYIHCHAKRNKVNIRNMHPPSPQKLQPRTHLIYILPGGMISGVEERRFSQNWACVEKRALKTKVSERARQSNRIAIRFT